MVSVSSVGELAAQALWGLGCLVGMIVLAIIAIIMGKKEE